MKKILLITSGILVSLLLFLSTATPQQRAAGAGGRGGGGFRQPDPIDFNEHAGWVSLPSAIR